MLISDQKKKCILNRYNTSYGNYEPLKLNKNGNKIIQESYENKIKYNNTDKNVNNFKESNSKFCKYIKRNMKILRNQDYKKNQCTKLIEKFNDYLHKEVANNKFSQTDMSSITLNNENSNKNLYKNLKKNLNNKCVYDLNNEKFLNGKIDKKKKQPLNNNNFIYKDNYDYNFENGNNENYEEKKFQNEIIFNSNDNEIENLQNNSQNKINLNLNNKHILTDVQNSYSIFDRLFKLHPLIESKKIKTQEKTAEREYKQCSFNPKINDNSKRIFEKKYKNKPKPNFIERSNIFTQSKIEKISRAQKENILNIKNMSEPKISSKNNDEIFERLYNDNFKRNLIKENNKKIFKELDMKECTFKPEIYINDLNNIDNNDFEHFDFDDFLERQRKYEKNKKNDLLNKSNNINFQLTFKPEISPNSEFLIQKKQKTENNCSEKTYNKLYNESKTLQNKKEKLKEIYDSQFNYTPKINHISKILNTVNINKNDANTNSYNSKTYNIYNQKKSFGHTNSKKYRTIFNNSKNEKYEKHDNEDDEKNCTFKPKLYQSSKYKNICSTYKNDHNMMNRIQTELKEKQEKILYKRKSRPKFNFSPEINHSIPKFNKNLLNIKGVPQYLSNMEKSRQKKRDQKQREKEVFATGEKWNSYKVNNVIQIQPFSFMKIHEKFNSKTINAVSSKKRGKSFVKKSKSNKNIISKLIK